MVQASALLNPFRRLVGAGARSVGGGLSSFFALGYTGAEQTAPVDFYQSAGGGSGCLSLSLNPKSWDTDDDGLPDSWEITYGMDEQIANAGNDTDGDGLTNLQEYTLNTNPLLADTDGDGLGDYGVPDTWNQSIAGRWGWGWSV